MLTWLRTQESNLVGVAYETSPPSPTATLSPWVESNHRLRLLSPNAVLQQGDRADDANRTRLNHVGNVMPHQSASSANTRAGTGNRTRSARFGRPAPHLENVRT